MLECEVLFENQVQSITRHKAGVGPTNISALDCYKMKSAFYRENSQMQVNTIMPLLIIILFESERR